MTTMICFTLIYLLPLVFAASFHESEWRTTAFISRETLFVFVLVNIHSDDDCLIDPNAISTKRPAVLVNFAPAAHYRKENCAVNIGNFWSPEMQNGLGVFLDRPMDCSMSATVECLPGSLLPNRVMIFVFFIPLPLFGFSSRQQQP